MTSVTILVTWCGGTAALLLFGGAAPLKAIRSWVVVTLLGDVRRSRYTVIGACVVLSIGLVAQEILSRRQSVIDEAVDRSLTHLLAGRAHEARVAFDNPALSEARNAYDKQTIALASLAFDVTTAASDNNRDHQWWAREGARIQEWLRLNDRQRFACEILLAKICFRMHDLHNASLHLAAAAPHVATAEQGMILQFFRGEILMETSGFAAAEAAFRDGLPVAEASGPASSRSELYNRIAICCYQQRKWAEAEGAILAAIDVNPNTRPMLLSNYGLIAMLAGKPRVATDALNEAVTLDPNDAVAHMNLGICHVMQGNWLLARDALQQAKQTLDKSRDPAQRSADMRLVGLLEAWRCLRSGQSMAAVIDAGRIALGHTSDLVSSEGIANEQNRASDYCQRLGRQIISDQHFYGLEFIAADFLRHAVKLAPEAAAVANPLLASLPASANLVAGHDGARNSEPSPPKPATPVASGAAKPE